jgi:hypothetical protein
LKGERRKSEVGAFLATFNEISNLSSVLGEGFFADRVVTLLAKRKSITTPDREVLKEFLISQVKREEVNNKSNLVD